MKSRRFLSLIVAYVAILAWPPAVAQGQTTGTDEPSISKEILARYRSFEGTANEQTWEKWQEYFLRSPNIGNMHGSHLEMGWEMRPLFYDMLIKTPDGWRVFFSYVARPG